jgi:hypothetical protein
MGSQFKAVTLIISEHTLSMLTDVNGFCEITDHKPLTCEYDFTGSIINLLGFYFDSA